MNSVDSRLDTWADKAYAFLLDFSKKHDDYMAEDVRQASTGYLPEPSSTRAWGGVFAKAARNNIIKRIGYRRVKNPNANCNASVWRTTLYHSILEDRAMNQKSKVLAFLLQGSSITSFAAFELMGITRISAHIHALKKEGHPIVREDIEAVNRYGKKTVIGRWKLDTDAEQQPRQSPLSFTAEVA
jgi:hypothetical protein